MNNLPLSFVLLLLIIVFSCDKYDLNRTNLLDSKSKNFKPLPELTTSSTTAIASNSATIDGDVTSEGGAQVTNKGVCWSTSTNPTINLSTKTLDGTGLGTFTSRLTDLAQNTTYHARAYATNSFGTAYGNELTFTTSSTLTDIDGNVYNTVIIGTQVWMKENLKTTKYNDGRSIPNITDNTDWSNLTTPGYCWYDNNETTNKNIYGALYNWYSVNTGKLCPPGWQVPSDEEWTILAEYLGGENVAGGKLKEIGETHWASANIGATNETGFTALPAGTRRDYQGFTSLGYYGYWWSATEYLSPLAYVWYVHFDKSEGNRATDYFTSGLSVRCLQGAEDELPILTTTEVSAITPTTATSGGNISSDGGATITTRGVCWSTSINPTILDNKTSEGPGIGNFTSSLYFLSPETTYYLRAYATNTVGTVYGNEVSFTTHPVEIGPIFFNLDLTYGSISDIDGNIYKTIQIGTQTWMAENLKTTRFNDNTAIPNIIDNTSWPTLSTPAYCWYNNGSETYREIYGGLYNWYAVNTNKLCPTGWHVPSESEWILLTDLLGGESIAGDKLKEAGIAHWNNGNNGSNSSGFTALPGGVLIGDRFGYIGIESDWWTSSQSNFGYAWRRAISWSNSSVEKDDIIAWPAGLSVRCLKDL